MASKFQVGEFELIVDDCDFNLILSNNWYARTYTNTEHVYFGATIQSKPVLLHREIMGHPKGLTVDHVSGDTLDNRRENLRVCTIAENLRNRKVAKHSSTGLKGVQKHRNLYRVRISVGGRRVIVGTYKCPIEAAKAYDAAAIEHYGEFSRTNADMGLI